MLLNPKDEEKFDNSSLKFILLKKVRNFNLLKYETTKRVSC